MLPFLPFALGLLTGAAAVRALKSDPARSSLNKAKSSLNKAEEHLREVVVSGLAVIENSSARVRNRLSGRPEPAVTPEAPTPANDAAAGRVTKPISEAITEPAPKPRRAAAPRKRTPKATPAGNKDETS